MNLCWIGWTLRNQKGDVIWMGARAIPKLRTVVETKAEGLRWGVQTLVGFGYTRIIFEFDSKDLVDVVTEKESWPTVVMETRYNSFGF